MDNFVHQQEGDAREQIEKAQGQIDKVVILSPGGDFLEAIRIGRAIRELQLSTGVPGADENGQAVCSVWGEPKDPLNCTLGQAPVLLFDIIDAPDDGLMKAMDQINARYGRGTARLGLAQKDGEWHMRR